MKLQDAADLARQLIQHWTMEAFDRGWVTNFPRYAFKWHDKKNALGTCDYGKKLVLLSKTFTLLNTEEQMRDTILHEIAHMLAYEVDGCRGHGAVWKRWAVRVGARPERCASDCVAPVGRYIVTCTECGRQHSKHRLSQAYRNGLYASGCCKAKFRIQDTGK